MQNKNKSFKTFLTAATLVGVAFTFFSCKKNDLDDLQEAQYCLNKAAPSAARACVAPIASQTSQSAYKLKCAAVFIANNFGSPASFSAAINQISHPTGSGCSGADCSGSLNAMNVLNFGTDTATADEAVGLCTKSGIVAYSQMSSMFAIGTLLKAQLGGNTTPDAAALQAALNAMPADQVGAIVVASYGSSCSDLTNASEETKKYCSEMSVAMAATGGSNAQIGACMKYKMDNPSAVTCP